MIYKNYIKLLAFLFIAYALLFACVRAFLHFWFASSAQADILNMYKIGFLLDGRAICPVLCVFLLLGILNSACNFLLDSEKLHLIFEKFFYKITLSLVGIFSALMAFCAIGNFYYFKTYHTKIDTFIFGLKDDDTLAILKIIWLEYPVIWIVIFCAIFSLLCVKISAQILKISESKAAQNQNLRQKLNFQNLKVFSLNLVFTALLILALIIGIRGSVGKFPLREDAHHFSANIVLNHIATNPIIAFGWALANYKSSDNFAPVSAQAGEQLQEKMFNIFHKIDSKSSLDSQNFSQNSQLVQPHIIAVLLESFGANMLALDDEQTFDVLGNFRIHFQNGLNSEISESTNPNAPPPHLKTDFTFLRSLSGKNGTAPSFAQLFFESPSPTISLGSAKNVRLKFTPFDIYKNAGYRVIYITSGNRSWQNFGDYILTLGADEVYDSNYILSHFERSSAHKNTYGVADEWAFKLAFEILENTKEPVFISILTTTNHPPFALPSGFEPPNFALDSEILSAFKSDDEQKIKLIAAIFNYSSSAFGDFISSIKDSEKLSQNVIVAASGDHLNRDLTNGRNIFLDYAAPIYFYVPQNLQNFARDFGRFSKFDGSKLASHKDIFSTLYALSLQDYEFMSLGGRNLFLDSQNLGILDSVKAGDFALNAALLIVRDCIFAPNVPKCMKYEIGKNGFLQPTKFSESSDEISEFDAQDFFKNYNALNWWQLNSRIFE